MEGREEAALRIPVSKDLLLVPRPRCATVSRLVVRVTEYERDGLWAVAALAHHAHPAARRELYQRHSPRTAGAAGRSFAEMWRGAPTGRETGAD
jgi:hypothetical protein